ncbi:carbohydrate sulfotransferase 8-like isoform X3 [Styela clava]|uniref:carbohydrate sulfotransferase 8-like isoform X3 n=1 Tax=Styela clava TaxID=7725 RepID=UPI00193A7E17|nr:carbohydrate sulfotransferase 8-like isoform X3 [Styela clava]
MQSPNIIMDLSHLNKCTITCFVLLLGFFIYINVTSSYLTNRGETRKYHFVGGAAKVAYSPKRNMEELAKSRNENLRKRCGSRFYNGTIKSGTWDSLPPLCKPKLYYSDKHKLIACTIPKSGSTSWRKALLISDGVVNASSPEEIAQEDAFKLGMKKRYLWLHFKNNSTRTRAEINKRLNEYYRIIVVREPLERIVSAYLDKIVHGRKKYARIALSMHNGTVKSDEKIPLLKHKWKTEYQEYLESLPKDKLMKLFNIYSRDYELFGYSIPQFVLSSKNKN